MPPVSSTSARSSASRASVSVAFAVSSSFRRRAARRSRLALRPQLVELFELVREVEFRLDVCLVTGGADVRVVALCAEQEAECLREDRLPGAGLARDRVQPGRELELGLADEDEVLDTEPP